MLQVSFSLGKYWLKVAMNCIEFFPLDNYKIRRKHSLCFQGDENLTKISMPDNTNECTNKHMVETHINK